MAPVYLDFNATTPVDPRVFEAMTPWFTDQPGNASSRTHVYGQRAREAVEAARCSVAAALHVRPVELIFTSGATESNNLAILGLARHGIETGRRHVISTAIEHKAVLEPLAELSRLGFEVELAPVTSGGYVEPDEIRRRIRPDTLLVSVMHANNETGVLQPVHEIGDFLANTATLFHVDAAQTFGKEVEALRELRCDLLALSGHKIYGPKGIGALYTRRQPRSPSPLAPICVGGGQEHGLRAGTLPVPLIVGLGKASELATREYRARRLRAADVKARFSAAIQCVDHRLNGDQQRCQAHVLNVSFPGIDSEALMMLLRREVAISNGSACTSASYSPSHVLRAMGLSPDLAASAVRISWGATTDDIPADLVIDAVGRLKVHGPVG